MRGHTSNMHGSCMEAHDGSCDHAVDNTLPYMCAAVLCATSKDAGPLQQVMNTLLDLATTSIYLVSYIKYVQ